ncbi:hypothetical protein [Flavobacterium tegetincola]|uniref:hypothetical protein n=1 Tax=Flavobacterium tegetincola TaxID=150172 RepID=UPI0004257EEB|nr:hypothetical protein [Flavobacterium tegetincola]
MKKFVLILLFFSIIPLWSQSTPASKITTDSTAVAIDTSDVVPVYFKENFKENYNGTAFKYEEAAPVKSIWERFKEWFSEWLNRTFDVQDSARAMTILDYAINTIAVLLILVVIYLIVKAILNKEGTWIFGSKSDANLIRYDEIEKNLHLVDFEKLIKQSIQSGEHRLTIRYYYLFVLKKMSEKELIEWDVEKTNSDYLYEIKSPQLKANFEYLSYLYNYIWYGEFELTATEFEKAKKAFDTTIQSIY